MLDSQPAVNQNEGFMLTEDHRVFIEWSGFEETFKDHLLPNRLP